MWGTPSCTSQSSLGGAGIHILLVDLLFFSERHSLCLWTAFHTLSHIACVTTVATTKLHTLMSSHTHPSQVSEYALEASVPKQFEKGLEYQRLLCSTPENGIVFFFPFPLLLLVTLQMPGMWESCHIFFWNEGLNSFHFFGDAVKLHRLWMSSVPHSRSPTLRTLPFRVNSKSNQI